MHSARRSAFQTASYLFAMLLAGVLAPTIAAHAGLCGDLLRQSLRHLSDLRATEVLRKSTREEWMQLKPGPERSPSILSVTRINRASPETSAYLFRKAKGRTWFSKYGREEVNAQGDPRWFSAIFGITTGRFFGFELLSPHEMHAPTPERMNAAIAHINRTSGHKITLRFRSAPGKVEKLKYLKDYADQGVIAIADEGILTVHDLAYHAAAVALPPKAIELSRYQTHALLSWLEYLDSHKSSLSPEARGALDELQLAGKLSDFQVKRIDVGTGNFVLHRSPGPKSPSYEWGWDFLTQGGTSPIDMLRDDVNMALTKSAHPAVRSELQTLLDRFEKTHELPAWRSRVRMTQEEFDAEIDARIDAFEKVAKAASR